MKGRRGETEKGRKGERVKGRKGGRVKRGCIKIKIRYYQVLLYSLPLPKPKLSLILVIPNFKF